MASLLPIAGAEWQHVALDQMLWSVVLCSFLSCAFQMTCWIVVLRPSRIESEVTAALAVLHGHDSSLEQGRTISKSFNLDIRNLSEECWFEPG